MQKFITHTRHLASLQDVGKLSIHLPRTDGAWYAGVWKRIDQKAARPWESVILPESIKDGLLRDCEEFLGEEGFYRERGLPYRRGYLLWGKPGSGKSSLSE
jgi:hypothetical protein